MRGTEGRPVRCVALLGEVGSGVRCSMYEQRSSTGREFEASWSNGKHKPACDAARTAHGFAAADADLSPPQVA